MRSRITPFIIMFALCCITLPSSAQGRGGRGGGRGGGGGAPAQPVVMSDQTMIGRIWNEGMTDKSQAATLAQVLLDSIGPRLTGSPGMEAASRWVVSKYQSWGIPARAEQYGTWAAWRNKKRALLLATAALLAFCVLAGFTIGGGYLLGGGAMLLALLTAKSAGFYSSS